MTCIASAASAQEAATSDDTAYSYRFADQQLVVTHGTFAGKIDLGCDPRSAVRLRDLVYVACGVAGVVQIDVRSLTSPRIVGVSPVNGAAIGVRVARGANGSESVFVTTADPTSSEASAPPAPFTLALIVPRPPEPEPIALASPGPKRPNLVSPDRMLGLETYAQVTAFAGTQTGVGVGGLLGWLRATYRFTLPVMLRAEAAPVGFAGPRVDTSASGAHSSTTNEGLASVAAGHVLLGLDTQYFEIAMGAGGATVNDPPNFSNAPCAFSSFNGCAPPPSSPATTSPTFVQSLRVGAYDGLSFEVESALFTTDPVRIGFAHAIFKIPLTPAVALALRGGGGKVGTAYGDLAVRVRVRGDNGRGTVALWLSGGVAHVGLNLCNTNPDPPFSTACNTADITGPALGLGLEWRP